MMISRVTQVAGEPLGWALFLAVLVGLTHAGESTAAAPAYEAEIQDLRRLPAQDCLHTEFEPLELSNGAVLYRAYLRTDKEALMIHDPNPDPWKAMLAVAEQMNRSASAR